MGRLRYDRVTGDYIGTHAGMTVRVTHEAWRQECRAKLDPLLPPEYHAGQAVPLPDEYYEMSDTLLTTEYWLAKGEREQ